MELITRNLFIDTQYFIRKSFDFLGKEFTSLEDQVKSGHVKVFLTDINEREIRKKIKDESRLAVTKVNVSDARLLKVIPEFRKILLKYDEDKTEDYFLSAFENFKKRCKVKIVSSDEIKPIKIFENYCRELPPFKSSETKNRKGEFPDAFALAAISLWADRNNERAYLLSGDSDWEMFAKDSYFGWPFGENGLRFIYLSDLSTLLDTLIRNEKELEDITAFADSVIKANAEKVADHLRDDLENCHFEIMSIDTELELLGTYILDISLTDKDIIAVDRDGASFNIDCEVDLILKANRINFEKSIWDPQYKEYAYLAKDEILFRSKIILSIGIEFGFREGIASNFEIKKAELPSFIFVDYDESEYIDQTKWILQMPVIVCGVKDGQITADGHESQNFENLREAMKVFPDLNVYKGSKNFTQSMGDKITGELRFETWKAYEVYST